MYKITEIMMAEFRLTQFRVGNLGSTITQGRCYRPHEHTYPFYSPLDCVQDYPDEMVPEPIWILLKQETVSGSGMNWAICKSAPWPSILPLSFLQAGCPSCHPANSVKPLKATTDHRKWRKLI